MHSRSCRCAHWSDQPDSIGCYKFLISSPAPLNQAKKRRKQSWSETGNEASNVLRLDLALLDRLSYCVQFKEATRACGNMNVSSLASQPLFLRGGARGGGREKVW